MAPSASPYQNLTGSLWDKAFSKLNEDLKSSLGQAKTHKRDILAAVLRAAEDKRDTSLRKRWKVKLPNGEAVIVRDVLEKIARWVVRFKEIGDTAVQFDTTQASFPWAAVRFLLQATVNDIQQYGALMVDIEIISRLVTRYKEFELLYLPRNAPVPSALDDALTSLYTEVLTYLARAVDILSEKTLVRLAKAPFRLGDEEQMQCILKREDEVLKLAKLDDVKVLHSLEISVVRLVDQASIASRMLDRERHVKMVRWLSTSPYSAHHETITEYRAPNFGQWLLQHREYKDWCQSSSPSVLLLHGIPGSGKTHLCSVVVDELLKTAASQASSAPFAYFYCLKTDSEPERSSVDEILRSILRQLAITDETQPRVKCLLDTEFEQRSKSADLSGLDLPRLKTKHCVDLIIELANDSPITIIFDAIDQIQDSWRFVLFDELNRILNEAANVVKIFMTSRNDSEVLLSFSSAKTVSITSANVRGDMQEFILRELDNARLMNGRISSEVRTAIADALLSGAGEMFLWAQRQIQQLRMRKIKHEDDLLPALETNILADLDQLYEETLQQVLSGGDATRSFVIHVFSWLLYMKSPLTLSALMAAMSVVSANSATIQPLQVSDMCAHLIVADIKRDAVRFAHQSIKEYLLRAKQDLFSPYLSHGLLTSTCIEVCSRGPPDGQPLEVQPISIYVYAAMYWAVHLKGSEVPKAQDDLFLRMLSFVVDKDDMTPSLSFEIWMDTAAELAVLLPYHHPMKPALDAIPNEQSSPIFLAAVFGINGLLELVAESNPETDWNQENRLGHTAVYLAAALGHASTVSILIDQGADVNVECGRYGSPLYAACYGGHDEAVKQLLSHGASSTCGKRFQNALEASAHGDHEDIAIILIQGGTIKTEADYEHALHIAAEFGLVNLLSELQKPIFNSFWQKDMIDRQKARTTKAIKGGQLGVLQKFLSRAPDPSMLLAADSVAAAATYGHNEIIRFLDGIGMDIEAKGELGTPLRSACLMGRMSTVQLLVEYGAGAKLGSLDDALHAAAAKGYAVIVKLLIQEGADVNHQGGTFGTALQAAAYTGHKETVEVLVDAGADVYAQGYSLDAFHAAAEGGHQEIVLLLLMRGYKFKEPPPNIAYRHFSPLLPPSPSPFLHLFEHVTPDRNIPGARKGSDCHTKWESVFAKRYKSTLEACAATGQVGMARLYLNERLYLETLDQGWHATKESVVLDAMKLAAAYDQVKVLEVLLEWMIRRRPIRRYLLLILKAAGERKSHNTIEFALSVASENGITTDEINQLRLKWPPSHEKYRDGVIDAEQIKHDFMWACTSGDEDGVCSILECKFEALLDRAAFTRGIELAAKAGHEPLLVILLRHLHLLFPQERLVSDEACIAAAENNDIRVLKLLLSGSEDSGRNVTLLGRLACIACSKSYPDIIRYLVEELKMEVNMNVADDHLGHCSYEGEEHSREGRLTSLLQVALRSFGQSPFWGESFQAIGEEKLLRRTEIVTCLLAHGADPSALSGQDAFPIQVAANICPEIVVRQLIEAGADVTRVHEGKSAMDAAMAREWGSASIVQMILEAGGAFPVDFEKAQVLIERVAKFFRKIKDRPVDGVREREVPAHVLKDGLPAVLELVELLLRHYSYQKTDDMNYLFVLEAACQLGKRDFIELLLSRGTDPNGSGDYHGIPIQAAAGSGHHGIVRLLLEHGASVNINIPDEDAFFRRSYIQGQLWHSALRAAIVGGHSDIIHLLLSYGADIDFKPKFNGNRYESALQLAVASGDINIVNALLEAGADVHEDDSCWSHPLILACRQGCVNITTALLEAGAPVDVSGKPSDSNSSTVDLEQASPLHAAIDGGHVQIIELLLTNGADVNKDMDPPPAGPALLAAVQKNDLCIVRRLLVAGAEINHVSCGRTALLEAVHKDANLSIVKELLAQGAVAAGSNYPNCLVRACCGGSVDLVELLLESIYGNHDQPETIIDEALDAVVRQDQPNDAIICLLLDYLPPTQQRFALVCFSGSVSNVVSMLDAGMSAEGEETTADRPIHVAIRELRDEVARVLVQRGADVHYKSPRDGTPLMCTLLTCAGPCLEDFQPESTLSKSLSCGHHYNDKSRIWKSYSPPVTKIRDIHKCMTIVQLLIDHGADPDVDECAFGKPLHIACLIGSTAIVTKLVEGGADVNSISGYFETPLFAAICGEDLDVVSLLLEQGAGVNYMHQAYRTPLQLACAMNNKDIACKLLQHGASVAVASQAGEPALTLALSSYRAHLDYTSDGGHGENSLPNIILRASPGMQLSEHDILAAARIRHGACVLASLLETNKEMLVSENLIVRLLELEESPEIDSLKLLFERSGGLGITEKMLMVELRTDTLKHLLEFLPVCKVTPTIMENQQELGLFELLLNSDDSVEITESVVLKALNLSGRCDSQTSVLDTIWGRKPSLAVTELMLKTAKTSEDLQFLLERFGPANGMLQDVASFLAYEAPLTQYKADMLWWLLYFDPEIRLVPDMIAEVMSLSGSSAALDVFLTHEPGLPITEELFSALVTKIDPVQLAGILHKHGKKLKFTQNTRDAIDRACVWYNGMDTKKLLYSLREGDEMAEEIEAWCRTQEDDEEAKSSETSSSRVGPLEQAVGIAAGTDNDKEEGAGEERHSGEETDEDENLSSFSSKD